MKNKNERSNEIIENEELITLILFFSENNYTLKTRLIKLLFVFDKILPINEDISLNLDFYPYNYGPMIDYEEYELLIDILKNYRIIKVEEEEINRYSSQKIKIKIREENKEQILHMIERKLIPEKPQYKIELIKKVCNLFPNGDNPVLVQFVYYLKENFATRSIIKPKIFDLPKKPLQERIIIIMKELRVRFVIKILDNISEILKIFNVDKMDKDYSIFQGILEIFQKSLESNCLNVNEDIIKRFDDMALKDKKYHKLKISLLDLFLKNLNNKWDNEIVISVLIYILRSLCLDWPLEKPSDRKDFVSLTSKIYQDHKFFYKPEEIFSILEKFSPTEEELRDYISGIEKDLIYTEENNMDEESSDWGDDLIEETGINELI